MSTRTLLLAWLAALTIAAVPRPARAVDPARDPITLQGNPGVIRLKQEQISETARQERLEANKPRHPRRQIRHHVQSTPASTCRRPRVSTRSTPWGPGSGATVCT